jgi:hypothetical protein
MARIGSSMTRTPWYDQRQYHRQGPALLAEGHTVVYLAGIPPDIDLLQICSVELLPLGIVAKLLRLTKVVYDCREDMLSEARFRPPAETRVPWLPDYL